MSDYAAVEDELARSACDIIFGEVEKAWRRDGSIRPCRHVLAIELSACLGLASDACCTSPGVWSALHGLRSGLCRMLYMVENSAVTRWMALMMDSSIHPTIRQFMVTINHPNQYSARRKVSGSVVR